MSKQLWSVDTLHRIHLIIECKNFANWLHTMKFPMRNGFNVTILFWLQLKRKKIGFKKGLVSPKHIHDTAEKLKMDIQLQTVEEKENRHSMFL